ncbi:hypothetical protein FT663_01724 [Candidozyma haemuli var. vulneris]|nr:hypothetical protein FT662_01802 [[Candida] haemuloni var. vulneris]KAF3993824.1 hypothetical protein FT663_01724 [[Candida] haemuloni var. vulneris]
MFSPKMPTPAHPNIPGAWTVGRPKSEWPDPPKTLNPKFYSPEPPEEASPEEYDVTESWKCQKEEMFGTELQSLKGYSPSPSPTGSSPFSSKVFSPGLPQEGYVPEEAEVTSSIEPHMTGPLLPDSAPLDFSCLMPQAGLVMASAAAPMAGCWDFDPANKTDENVLLHVLAEDFDRIALEPEYGPKIMIEQEPWHHTVKGLAWGLSSKEYHKRYYWAKYVHDEEN